MLKLLKGALIGKQTRKPGVAQAGNYAAPVDRIDDPLIAGTLGLSEADSSVVRPLAAARDTSLDALARKAGRKIPARKAY